MIKIIDTYSQIDLLYENGRFDLENWKVYANAIYEELAEILIEELNVYFTDGKFTFEKDFLPIILAAYKNRELEALHESFHVVTNDLDSRVKQCFGKALNLDIVLYLGLGGSAGKVMTIKGKDVIFLGAEKIIELNWQRLDDMYGLIYHELGHIFHKQYGVFEQVVNNNEQEYVWQLFTEGIAMYFEQKLMNDYWC